MSDWRNGTLSIQQVFFPIRLLSEDRSAGTGTCFLGLAHREIQKSCTAHQIQIYSLLVHWAQYLVKSSSWSTRLVSTQLTQLYPTIAIVRSANTKRCWDLRGFDVAHVHVLSVLLLCKTSLYIVRKFPFHPNYATLFPVNQPCFHNVTNRVAPCHVHGAGRGSGSSKRSRREKTWRFRTIRVAVFFLQAMQLWPFISFNWLQMAINGYKWLKMVKTC